MIDFIRGYYMGGKKIRKDTPFGRQWYEAMSKSLHAEEKMQKFLRRDGALKERYEDCKRWEEELEYLEERNMFHEGFRCGFFLAADLFGVEIPEETYSEICGKSV